MRKMALALLLLMSLTACTTSQAGDTPAPLPVPAPAPAPMPEPEPTRPAISPEELRTEPDLAVTTAKATPLYTGPGQFYLLIRQLPEGAKLTYLGNSQGWLKVRTPEGENGWLAAADLTLADRRGQPITFTANRSGQWTLETPGGLSLAVTRPGTGVLRLAIAGLSATEPEVLPLTPEALAILAPVPGDLVTALDVGEAGVSRLSITNRGLLVDMAGKPVHRVLEQGPGRLVIEFRPAVTAAATTGQGWKLAYTGNLRPVLRSEEGALVLDLPGAVWSAALPEGVKLEEAAPEEGAPQPQMTSTTAQVPTRMPAGGVRLRLAPANSHPYALYRPIPGEIELRFLPPGLTGKVIVVDAGHGGAETGAVGPAGTLEKNVNLAVALKLQPLLEAAGARVIMTRTADTQVLPPDQAGVATSEQERVQLDLAARSALANRSGADLYISIHANGGPPGDGGTEVFWAVNNLNAASSRHLADLAQEELLSALGLVDRGAKQRPFNVIRMSEAPAVLVELGFMTNAREERLLASAEGQDAAARALLRAIERYFAR
jgi:N-acetylmuramoyl-L-alanine amidase